MIDKRNVCRSSIDADIRTLADDQADALDYALTLLRAQPQEAEVMETTASSRIQAQRDALAEALDNRRSDDLLPDVDDLIATVAAVTRREDVHDTNRAADLLLCTSCGRVVTPTSWTGECPTCGNGTMREMVNAPPEKERT